MTASAVVVVGLAVWQVAPMFSATPRTTPSISAQPSTKAEPTEDSGTTETEEPAATTNLLTPAGMRKLVSQIKPVIGGTKIKSLVVYPEYASFEAPNKDDKTVYDRYSYRNGEAVLNGPGGKMDEPAWDLSKFNWDALPALIRRADKDLGVKKVTTRYLVIDPAFAFVVNGRVGMMLYAGDSYKSGYLVADVNGKILKISPA